MISEATILTALGAAGTTLTGAIVALWQVVNKQANEFKKRADDCEEKHETTSKKLLHVTSEVGELRGRIHMAEKVNVQLSGLSDMVETMVEKKMHEED